MGDGLSNKLEKRLGGNNFAREIRVGMEKLGSL